MIDISMISPLASGIFVLSFGYLFKQVSNLSRTIEGNKENLQSTRETYVPNVICKEDRNDMKDLLKEYKSETGQFRLEQRESTQRLHERMDDVIKIIKKNGNGK